MSDLVVDERIVIAASELTEQFVRASGPGGQNVNKVASAVRLFFDARQSRSLPEHARDYLERSGRLTRDGVLVIQAQRFREQERNRADARARLAEILRRAAVPPRPRRPTKVPRSSKKKRLETKKHRADLKQGRARPLRDS